MVKKILPIAGFLFLVGCSPSESQPEQAQAETIIEQGDPLINGRWYRQSQVNLGDGLFKENCTTCHGDNGQGTFGWKNRLADGSFPPPPLNGSGHAWHHPLSLLVRTISEGGISRGGKMPAFNNKLNSDEQVAIAAYFQNFWKDEIYQAWIQRGGLN